MEVTNFTEAQEQVQPVNIVDHCDLHHSNEVLHIDNAIEEIVKRKKASQYKGNKEVKSKMQQKIAEDSQTERESSKKSKRGSSKSNATDKVDKNLRKRTQKEKSKKATSVSGRSNTSTPTKRSVTSRNKRAKIDDDDVVSNHSYSLRSRGEIVSQEDSSDNYNLKSSPEVRVPKKKSKAVHGAVLAGIGQFTPNSPLSPEFQKISKKKNNKRESKIPKKAKTFKGYKDFKKDDSTNVQTFEIVEEVTEEESKYSRFKQGLIVVGSVFASAILAIPMMYPFINKIQKIINN